MGISSPMQDPSPPEDRSKNAKTTEEMFLGLRGHRPWGELATSSPIEVTETVMPYRFMYCSQTMVKCRARVEKANWYQSDTVCAEPQAMWERPFKVRL